MPSTDQTGGAKGRPLKPFGPGGVLGRWVVAVLIFLVKLYRWTLSPLKTAFFGPGAGCRFRPTCSQYAIDCFRALPLHKALWYATHRILRCQPWGGRGYDPVPGTSHVKGQLVYEETPPSEVTSLKDRPTD